MYLSRLVLNLRNREVRRDLGDCHALHRTLMSVWGQLGAGLEARRSVGLLYRIEAFGPGSLPTLLVQSSAQPLWAALETGYLAQPAVTKPMSALCDRLKVGSRLRFRLRANPTRCIREEREAGARRVELRRDDDRIAWLVRKGVDQHGFRILDSNGQLAVRLGPVEKVKGSRPTPAGTTTVVTIGATLYDGTMEVTDLDRFRHALAEGIGRGRAYGCGLLSIAPLTER
jgi:CRISPR system Cascade subunit CasE